MELRKGVTETEYGNFPVGWEFIKIQKLIDNKIIVDHLDGNHGSLYPRSNEFQDDGVPYISATDFLNGVVNFKNCKHLSLERAKIFQKGFAKNGDILFAHNATVGPVALLESNLDYIILSTTATYYRCDNKLLLNVYLKYALQSQYFVRQYQSVMAQSTRFQVPITAQRKFSIALPTKAEQSAIANALSDADTLISSLEKLIEKKRNIKQGAMQQLLKPKKGWVVKKLGEICTKVTTGRLDANAMRDDGEYRFYTCAKSYYHIDVYAFDDEALLVSGNGENVGYVHYFKGKFNAYQRTYVLLGFNESINYIKLFLDRYLPERISQEANSGNTPYIKMGTLTDMEIILPNSLKEQNEISNILIDMDKEIISLEKKLSKSKMLKQGMMQELLTGKIRLL